MRRKPKTESRQRNNRSLNTVGVPASAHQAGHLFDRRSLLFTVYEYAAAIAPPGQEASYGSLAYLPFLVGKLLVGTGATFAFPKPADGNERVPTILCLICEFN